MSDFSQHVPLSTFLQAHPDQGSLRVQVASGGGTFPVAGARVEVYRRFGGQTHTFYRGLTDESGIVQGIALPGPAAAWSQAPGHRLHQRHRLPGVGAGTPCSCPRRTGRSRCMPASNPFCR